MSQIARIDDPFREHHGRNSPEMCCHLYSVRCFCVITPKGNGSPKSQVVQQEQIATSSKTNLYCQQRMLDHGS